MVEKCEKYVYYHWSSFERRKVSTLIPPQKNMWPNAFETGKLTFSVLLINRQADTTVYVSNKLVFW